MSIGLWELLSAFPTLHIPKHACVRKDLETALHGNVAQHITRQENAPNILCKLFTALSRMHATVSKSPGLIE